MTREYRQIDMMMATTNKRIDIYSVEVKSLRQDFKLGVPVSKVDREMLLSLTNPEYRKILNKYQHLKGVVMDDMDEKGELPIHLIIGASEYAKIKTETKPKIGKPGEPVGELTKFGWTIISPGSEVDAEHLFFAGSSRLDYDKLCSLDILGLGEREVGNQSVFGEFAEQLEQKPEGFFETGLLWKGDCPPLPDNKAGRKIYFLLFQKMTNVGNGTLLFQNPLYGVRELIKQRRRQPQFKGEYLFKLVLPLPLHP